MPDPHDPIDWIKNLEGPEPPEAAPAWDAQPKVSAWPRRAAVGTVIALAASALLWVSLPSDDGIRLRGATGAIDIDLRVVVLTEAGPKRLETGQTYAPGQQLAFRVGATPASNVAVWAQGPAGVARLGTFEREPTPADLMGDGGLVALSLDVPGQWTVYASADGYERCPADACTSRSVTVAESSK